MKRLILTITVLTLVLGSSLSYADPTKAGDVIYGGIKGITYSPLQITSGIESELDRGEFLPFGVIGGALKGTVYMARDIIEGTLKLLTVPYYLIKTQ